MPDNDLVLRISHTLGTTQAKRRIAGAAAEVKARHWQYLYASDFEWDANRLSFRVTGLAHHPGHDRCGGNLRRASCTAPLRYTGARQTVHADRRQKLLK
jgi:hypothetical protein